MKQSNKDLKKSVKKASTRRKPKPNKNMKAMVNDVLLSKSESKISTAESGNQTCIHTAIGTNPINFDIVPVTTQGSGQFNRVGQQINCTQMISKVTLSYQGSASNVNDKPYFVRLMVGRLKTGVSAPSVAQYNNIGITSTGAYSALDSSVLAGINREINYNLFTIYYDKVHKIGPATPSATGPYPNNDYSLTKIVNINLTKVAKGVWKYATASDTLPQNKAMYMWAYVWSPDGTLSSTRLPFLNVVTSLRYRDD